MRNLLLIFILLIYAGSSVSCGTLADAITPDIPEDIAFLHWNLNIREQETIDSLEARVYDVSLNQITDVVQFFNDIQEIKAELLSFSRWLRKTGISDNVLEATIVRIRAWEDIQMFFCIQDDAYLKDSVTPLDELTRSQVLKFLDFLLKASNDTEKWIEEKGVIIDD